MPLIESLNHALHRVTGLRLTRETPQERTQAIRRAAREAATRKGTRAAERRKGAAPKVGPRAASRGARGRKQTKANDPLATYDEVLRETVEQVSARTMTGPAKLVALVEATRYVVRAGIPGAVVECGVWRGGSMQAVALTLMQLEAQDRDLHLFDTFKGMPSPTAHDTRTKDGVAVPAEELLAEKGKDSKLWAVAGLDDVRAGMTETGYPEDLVHYHPGMVEETTPGEAPDTIAILRLDTDWYLSTKHELEHLYDRLSPGGVLILDDYGDWDGARKATDEWIARTGEPLFLLPMGSGRIAVKPGGALPSASAEVSPGH